MIHGDNLEALKALLPQYEGRVKCIYIEIKTIGLIQRYDTHRQQNMLKTA